MRKSRNSGSKFFVLAIILGCLLNPIDLPDAAASIYQNTTRSGNTDPDETWRGTITVTGDVTVAYGSTLTIEPGTTVKFAAGSDDQHKGDTYPITDPYFPHDPATAPSSFCSINIYGGTLHAVGTSDKKIVFTSSATTPKPGDWQSIQYILQGSVLRLQYAVIEYGYYGVQINTNATDSNIITIIMLCVT